MNRFRLPLFALALLAGAMSGRAAAATPPNFIVIFADDLGYGDLGCFGNPVIATPNLDAMATRGLKLTSFYSAPSCIPARTHLILGKYSGRVNLGGTSAGGTGGIADSEVTLPEALKAAGYETAMVGKWHLGSAQDKFLPTGQGFDSWFGLPYSNDMVKPWVQTDAPLWLYENNRKVEHPVQHDTLLQRYTARCTEFIRKGHRAPYFLYFAPAMVHLPLAASERFRGKSRAGLFGDAVEELDWSVGEILRSVRETGQEQNTLIVFTSDNGPWINLPDRMLQAGNTRAHVGSAGALRNSKGSTYEGGPRVPAIVQWTGRVPAGASSAEIVSTLDVHATLVRLGTGAPARHQVDGYDLTDFLTGRSRQSPRQEFFYFNGRQLDGVRAGPWKLRVRDGVELFHLDHDPSERVNREKEHPSIVADLQQRLQKMAEETGAVRKARGK